LTGRTLLRPWWALTGAGAVLVAVLVTLLVVRMQGSPTRLASLRATGIPTNVPTRLANLMGLSPEPEHDAAPGFTLVDQHGARVSLSSFRGHPVVLTFLDPHCVTMCPIIAQEFVDAEHDLAHQYRRAVFLAVNVNRHALSVATVEAFTKEHLLDTIPAWHFLTGTLSTLKRIWSEYGVQVATRIVHGQWTVVHTTIDFFIGPNGSERYIASPNADYRTTATHRAYLPAGTYAAWGRGIALVAHDM
jgi:cytochrome oxidase Cu insertion factor (SCO1/SenC/PrrC family)